MEPDGSRARQLTHDEGYRDEAPQWSMDGERILFARIDFDQRDLSEVSLWWLDPGSGDVEPVDVSIDAASFYDPRYFGTYGLRLGHLQWEQVFDWWQSGGR